MYNSWQDVEMTVEEQNVFLHILTRIPEPERRSLGFTLSRMRKGGDRDQAIMSALTQGCQIHQDVSGRWLIQSDDTAHLAVFLEAPTP